MERISARSLLGRVMGFRDCAPQTQDALVAAGLIRRLAKGEALVRRGDPFDRLGLLVEGVLEVSVLRHDGHRHLVSFLQPGDLVGLLTMIDGMGHHNDLIAHAGAALVLLIPGAEVRRLRRDDEALTRAIELQLAFRSRLLYERFAADASMPLAARLAGLLQTLAGLYGSPSAAGVVLELKISQTDLADWLGVTRQRINAAVKELRGSGLLRLDYSRITITDPARMAELARL